MKYYYSSNSGKQKEYFVLAPPISAAQINNKAAVMNTVITDKATTGHFQNKHIQYLFIQTAAVWVCVFWEGGYSMWAELVGIRFHENEARHFCPQFGDGFLKFNSG